MKFYLNIIKNKYNSIVYLLKINKELLILLFFSRNRTDNDINLKYYERRYSFLTRLAARWDFHLYNKYSMWGDEKEFWNLWKQFPEWDTRYRAERKFVLWSLAKSVKNIPGDTVECGVLSGASSFLICNVLGNGSDKTHHVFDSFEGLSEPSKKDVPISDTAPVWTKGDLSVSLDIVKNNLSQYDFVRFYQGWIPDRFNEVSDRTFSFVHIDVDLYEPTLESIKFFYERLMPGGVLLCDDYGSHWCNGARQAFDEFIVNCKEQSVIHLPTQQGFIIKR